MECIIVQDLLINETAKFAHIFFPGSSFLEKDGTFTNAERRISRVRKVMPPLAGMADWEITVALSNALGYPMHYDHPSQIMDEIAAFFEAEPDRAVALEGIAGWVDDHQGEGLRPSVRDAIAAHRDRLMGGL